MVSILCMYHDLQIIVYNSKTFNSGIDQTLMTNKNQSQSHCIDAVTTNHEHQ